MIRTTSEFIHGFDRFPQPVRLNFDGKTEVSSICGVVVTLMLYSVLIAYSVRRGEALLFRENPDVSLFEIKNKYSSEEWLDLDEIGFKIAFTALDYKTF